MKTIVNFLTVIAFAIVSIGVNAQTSILSLPLDSIEYHNATSYSLSDGMIRVKGFSRVHITNNNGFVSSSIVNYGLSVGTYWIYAEQNGTVLNASITIMPPSAPVGTLVSSSTNNTFCSGTPITFSVTTQAPEVTFLVNGVMVTSSASGTNYVTTDLKNGDIVSAQVRNGICIGTTNSIEVTIIPLPMPVIYYTNVSACGKNNGTITINSNPGDIYSWSNGMVTANITGLTPGTYTCDVVNQYGCVGTISQIITEPIAVSK